MMTILNRAFTSLAMPMLLMLTRTGAHPEELWAFVIQMIYVLLEYSTSHLALAMVMRTSCMFSL